MDQSYMYWHIDDNKNLYVYTKDFTKSKENNIATYAETINGLFTGYYSVIELHFLLKVLEDIGQVFSVDNTIDIKSIGE